MKKVLAHIAASALIALFMVGFAHAQTIEGGTPIPNPFKGGDTLMAFLQTIISKIILPIGAVLAVFFIILTGFKYVMARGNPGKIQDANRSLLYTSIGTAVLLGAWVIADVIKGTVDQFK